MKGLEKELKKGYHLQKKKEVTTNDHNVPRGGI